MNTGFRVGRIAGIDISLDWSLLIVFVLIVLSLGSGLFPAWHPDWSVTHSWATALAAALLFFVSVLLHELSHALVGRRVGIPVGGISLFVFGGIARLEREPQHWRAELWMAIVGPVTSLAIGIGCLLLVDQIVDQGEFAADNIEHLLAGLGTLPTLLLWLGQINILLALFNLVPGFPLDGGRVLRAVLWGATGNLRLATRWASAAGQFFAWILIFSGVAMMLGYRVPVFGTGFIGGLWISFIGWFLHSAALFGYRQLLLKESLENVPVSRLMQTDFASVPPDMPVDRLVEDHVLHSDQRGFPVTAGDRVLGMVCLQDVRRIARQLWQRKTVSEIMTPAQALVSVTPEEDVQQALSRLGKHGINQILVMEGDKMRGLIRREDIVKWLSLYEGVDAQLALGRG